MSQLLTLIWLKWKILRNSLRSSKAVANQIASLLSLLVTVALALVLALGLGILAFAISQPGVLSDALRGSASQEFPEAASAEFILFSILGFLYLMWATVPLSIGGARQFDAGKMLMYPISLRKLFAVDFVSEVTTLPSIFAIPAIVAMSAGAGLGSGRLPTSLFASVPATLFGLALSKWLSTTIGSLVRRRRARGETILALIGVVAGLGGALAGQIAPVLFRHVESLRALRWTPPGAAAFLLIGSTETKPVEYVLAFLTLSGYTLILIIATFWIARRAALGLGGRRRQRATVDANLPLPFYTGWPLPFLSDELAAVVEKELRYAMRNAQMRMLSIMPLVLILIRLINSGRLGSQWKTRTPTPEGSDFLTYASGLLPAGGILYVFLILAGLSCNQFAYEEGGMRTLVLSPIDRSKILMGKNIAVTAIALVFSFLLLFINALVFRDLTLSDVLFAGLSFVVFAASMSLIGNWFSIRFPKRMPYGKRMNVSGVAGLLLIPLILLLAMPPLLAGALGYFTRTLWIEYVTLAAFGALSIGAYLLVIGFQGQALQRREIEILEAVREPE